MLFSVNLRQEGSVVVGQSRGKAVPEVLQLFPVTFMRKSLRVNILEVWLAVLQLLPVPDDSQNVMGSSWSQTYSTKLNNHKYTTTASEVWVILRYFHSSLTYVPFSYQFHVLRRSGINVYFQIF